MLSLRYLGCSTDKGHFKLDSKKHPHDVVVALGRLLSVLSSTQQPIQLTTFSKVLLWVFHQRI